MLGKVPEGVNLMYWGDYLFSYSVNGKIGLANYNGEILYPPVYDRIHMEGKYWTLRKNTLNGRLIQEHILVSETGKELFPLGQHSFHGNQTPDGEPYVTYYKKNGQGILEVGILYRGKLIEPQFKRIHMVNDGLIVVEKF